MSGFLPFDWMPGESVSYACPMVKDDRRKLLTRDFLGIIFVPLIENGP
jgi:hypothetical protein